MNGQQLKTGTPHAGPALRSLKDGLDGRSAYIDRRHGTVIDQRGRVATVRCLDELIGPDASTDPLSPLRWTLMSSADLADALVEKGHRASAATVRVLLGQMGYRAPIATTAGESVRPPRQRSQFEHINAQAKAFLRADQPVISVDCTKKLLVGGLASGADRFGMRGVADEATATAEPRGRFDVGAAPDHWTQLGDDQEGAGLSANAIRSWWQTMGAERYPKATRLLVAATAGGDSAGSCDRRWNVELAKLAAEIGLDITACHYPQGASKWNMTEHRLFSFVSMSGRGGRLVSYRTMVELTASATTATGLKVGAHWEPRIGHDASMPMWPTSLSG